MADPVMTSLQDRIQRLEQYASLQQQTNFQLQQSNQRLDQNALLQQQTIFQLQRDNLALQQTVNGQTDRAMAMIERMKVGAYEGRSEQMFSDYKRIWS